jgi:UPF0176 protein
MSKYTLSAMYKFISLPDFKELKDIFYQKMIEFNIKGTLLLAGEGINGTVSGLDSHIKLFLEWVKLDDRFSDIAHKESYYSESPFYRTKVKLKKEIVTMGIPDIDPKHIVGTYVKPKDWNKLISDPNVTLIDTRNDYEYMIGTFKGAINPETDTFREFPKYVDDNLSSDSNKKVAMFCTGGIRCEKSTALLKEKGFEDVYHLEGGILKYLEEVPKEESLWSGECFVFDGRVSVNHDLEKGQYDQCYACRLPLTDEEKTHPKYQKGISCHYCYDSLSDEQRKRFTEREKQITLAQSRNEVHIGSEVVDLIANKKGIKLDIKERQKSIDKGV